MFKMPVLSDADMGITGESAAPLPQALLSDADRGIASPNGGKRHREICRPAPPIRLVPTCVER